MPLWTKLNMMESTSPMMEQLMFFNDHSMTIIIMISAMTLIMMISTMINSFKSRNILENQLIETTWTIMPSVTLMLIALPSLKILYIMEELINPSISIKTMGHQWYWSYEYSDSNNIEFESYMKPINEEKNFRLLDVDNRTILPMMTQIRMIISSSDVIHSWTIPSLGVKMDAIPGRLNQIKFIIKKPGLFYGQCSEICGTNHSFMPITIESIKMNSFIKWIKSMN